MRVLSTTAGELPLEEVELGIDGRTWSVLHTGAVLSREDEQRFLRGTETKLPYGIVLWPSAIALAHELATRDLRGKRVLELGAGTGLPGIVAAGRGAKVVQCERQRVALHLCGLNAERNHVTGIEQRSADWTEWTDKAQYDLVVGADILYAPGLHPALRAIFDTNLAPGGRVLIADPYRESSLALLEQMEREGWRASLSKWTVGLAPPPRPIGVFEMEIR